MICNGLLRSKIFVVMSLCTSIERHGCIDHRNFQLDRNIIVRLKRALNATLSLAEARVLRSSLYTLATIHAYKSHICSIQTSQPYQ